MKAVHGDNVGFIRYCNNRINLSAHIKVANIISCNDVLKTDT